MERLLNKLKELLHLVSGKPIAGLSRANNVFSSADQSAVLAYQTFLWEGPSSLSVSLAPPAGALYI